MHRGLRKGTHEQSQISDFKGKSLIFKKIILEKRNQKINVNK